MTMIHKRLALSAMFALAGLISGCASQEPDISVSSQPGLAQPPTWKNDLAGLVYLAAQTLSERAETLDRARPIVVSTVVSVDDLEKSSTFGRLASQLVANRIEQRGYTVRDVTYMRAITLQQGTGELVLTREASKAFKEINAQAVVAGTYAVAGKKIYLNLRLLSADTGQILSSADVAIPLDENTKPLVGEALAAHALWSLDQYESMTRNRQIP